MTKPEFTPGPWKIDKCQCGHSACRSYLVSAIGSDGRCSLADAQLIAAAPDLYEALNELFELLEDKMPDWYLKRHFNTASHALIKAGGESK